MKNFQHSMKNTEEFTESQFMDALIFHSARSHNEKKIILNCAKVSEMRQAGYPIPNINTHPNLFIIMKKT